MLQLILTQCVADERSSIVWNELIYRWKRIAHRVGTAISVKKKFLNAFSKVSLSLYICLLGDFGEAVWATDLLG